MGGFSSRDNRYAASNASRGARRFQGEPDESTPEERERLWKLHTAMIAAGEVAVAEYIWAKLQSSINDDTEIRLARVETLLAQNSPS